MNSFKIRRTLLAVIAATTACVSLPAFASKEKPVIGFSIDDLRVERWARDRDYFIAAAKELGADVSVQSADGDSAKQVAQIENLISKKVDQSSLFRKTVQLCSTFSRKPRRPVSRSFRMTASCLRRRSISGSPLTM